MKRPYYIFSSGRMQRHQNTLYLRPFADESDELEGVDLEDAASLGGCPLEDLEEEDALLLTGFDDSPYSPRPTLAKRPIPVNDIEAIYLFGECDLNARFFNFLGKHRIPLHFFNYYGFYSGSFWPRQEVISGYTTVQQVLLYADPKKRVNLARTLVEGASFNILKTLRYYNAASRGHDLRAWIETIESNRTLLAGATDVPTVMGIEGTVRATYYEAWGEILGPSWAEFQKRVRRPPDNPVNALISFANSLCYTLCLSEIYRTALNPTISVLHQPGHRRFSLALDVSEIFKPAIVDRLIFRLINNGEIGPKHFDQTLNFCHLNKTGREIFIKAWEERLRDTFEHRTLKRRVSYRQLVRLECYKLQKHMIGIQTYEPFKCWW